MSRAHETRLRGEPLLPWGSSRSRRYLAGRRWLAFVVGGVLPVAALGCTKSHDVYREERDAAPALTRPAPNPRESARVDADRMGRDAGRTPPNMPEPEPTMEAIRERDAEDEAEVRDPGVKLADMPKDAAIDAKTEDGCAPRSANQPPDDLACTGLYSDVSSKQLAPGVRMYEPAAELWSDGADKTRWIFLPPDSQIDVSNPDEWSFPIGTQLFKEFQWHGRRAETRMFWKVSAGYWQRAAYRWNADETQAERFGGGMVDVGGESYYIPTAAECDLCHKGRTDSVLGFDAILLGLPGASGLTLPELIQAGRLTDASRVSALALADDGTGYGARALPWLHANCGVSCHTANSAAEAYSTGLQFRLLAADLDGSSTADVAARLTTIGVPAVTQRWRGGVRLVAGLPADSLMYKLLSTRDPMSPRDRMPPIASRIVPADGARLIADWISAMPRADDDLDAGQAGVVR